MFLIVILKHNIHVVKFTYVKGLTNVLNVYTYATITTIQFYRTLYYPKTPFMSRADLSLNLYDSNSCHATMRKMAFFGRKSAKLSRYPSNLLLVLTSSHVRPLYISRTTLTYHDLTKYTSLL